MAGDGINVSGVVCPSVHPSVCLSGLVYRGTPDPLPRAGRARVMDAG